MGYRYTKLFEQILESTIWCEPDSTRVVWITMLAMADKDGEVLASVPGLAKRANVSLAQCITALDRFQEPDEFSRTKDHEGRRIALITGGWVLLNHQKYRDLLDSESEKERKRKWWNEHRGKGKLSTGLDAKTSAHSTKLDQLAEASTSTPTTTKEEPLASKAGKAPQTQPPKGWWASEEGILAAGALVGLTAKKGESFPSYKARIESVLGQ